MVNKERLLDNFIKYVKMDTRSSHENAETPSSKGQFELAKVVIDDLKQAGLKDIILTKDCCLYGTIPGSIKSSTKIPTVGFVAHFDTTPDVPGENVQPNIINNYQGEKITFTKNSELFLDPAEEINLKKCIGNTIITSDGTTLLGADDKAGISALVELAHYFDDHNDQPHGDIKIGIMPDEEIGVGSEKFNLKEFGADVIYTLDGSFVGDIDIESFNGFKAKVTVQGNAAFPGYGKNIYLSSSRIISEFVSEMPDELWPENCSDRQDIFWADEIKGGVGSSEMIIFLRSFDLSGIENQVKILHKIKDDLLKKYPKAKINIEVSEMYKNYKNELDKDRRVVDYAIEAMKKIGITPNSQYVRGGSDACHFCFSGVLSTNLFIGMQRMHSFKEWVSLEVVEKSAETAISISKVWAEKSMI
ncbi:MAG: peptidase T [Deltaproteobacteria bacterium CG11_big_fil_rev_8_21_14_0_20_49_13]|nr:MAG: peptidase T [Deltaproteobacteria bacterium CG11_big_fil_rev_8_21_14_0_20_49_13]